MRSGAPGDSDGALRRFRPRLPLLLFSLLAALAPLSTAAASAYGRGYPVRVAAKRGGATPQAVSFSRRAPSMLGQTGLTLALNREMALAGGRSGALAYDITAGRTLYSMRAAELHPPASIEKLYTSTTALTRMGPNARLTTAVLGSGEMRPGGVWEGDLYLRGGGDPTFGSSAFIAAHYYGRGASVATLVQQLVHGDGIRRVTGRVLGDETYLDSLRGEPSSGYAFDPWLEGDLSGLAFNRGETGSFSGPHAPAAYAAKQLLLGLRRAGVRVAHGSGPALSSTPADASALALVRSPPLSSLLWLMLPPSDNFFAETLVKDLGARFGGSGSTAAGAAVVRSTIARLGLHPKVVDGSGLSREDLTSPEQVVELLRRLSGTHDGAVLRGDLAVAGRTGTLSERMRHSFAEGRCQGKTGTLEGVSNLAGYCDALDGHLIAFALFDDGIETYEAHHVQDVIAEAIATY